MTAPNGRHPAFRPIVVPDQGFSCTDRAAIITAFSEADRIESGLGKAIAGYVITGEDESVLSRIDSLLGNDDQAARRLKACLFPLEWHYYGINSQADQEPWLAPRRHLLFFADGFDAAGMRRFGLVQAKAKPPFFRAGTDRTPDWLRCLVYSTIIFRSRLENDRCPVVTAPRIREMLAIESASIAALVDVAFGHPLVEQLSPDQLPPALDAVLIDDAATASDAIRLLRPSSRAIVAHYLVDIGALARSATLFDCIFYATASNAKTVRDSAISALLKGDHAHVRRRALEALASTRVEDRIAGVTMLANLSGPSDGDRLEAHLASETSARVVQTIEAFRLKFALAKQAATAPYPDGASGYTAVDGRFIAPPQRRDTADVIPADTADILLHLMTTANANSRREYDAFRAENPLECWPDKPYVRPFDTDAIGHILDVLDGRDHHGASPPLCMPTSAYFPQDGWQTEALHQRELGQFLSRPAFGIKALVRLFNVEGRAWNHGLAGIALGEDDGSPSGRELARRVRAGADFREIADGLDAAGLLNEERVESLLQGLAQNADDKPEPTNPTIWPVLASRFDAIDRLLVKKTTVRRTEAQMIVLAICPFFPALPRRFLTTLIEAAAEGQQPYRQRARVFLKSSGDLTAVIAPLLQHPSPDRRAGAAHWLAERRDATAIAPLRAALAVEKRSSAKAAILSALRVCGDDISDQFSEGLLAAEARRAMKRAKTDFSAIMDPAALPRLRWADGRAVDPTIVEYWFSRAYKEGNPGGDPLLGLALERLDRGDAGRLGRDILVAFVQLDTRRPTSEEANAYAAAQADARFQTYRFWLKDYTREEAFADLRQSRLADYAGNALDFCGLLALARYTPAGEAVAIVRRYLRDHSKRKPQGRALLDMLAADPVPRKLQLILAIARSHKIPRTRKHAGAIAATIASERGWTAADLADRAIPDLGLDEAATLPLPIGKRRYRLCLGGDLKLSLESPAGKIVTSLPSPSDPSEAEQAKSARSILASARKELKETVETQTARLYEAMCTGRLWTREDFTACFIDHPIMNRLFRRLVIEAHDANGAIVANARLLDDGSLTDSDDGAVDLGAYATVRLAHRATLGDPAADAWRAHFADYAVAPLFQQFDRPLLRAADVRAIEINDRYGYAVDNRRLRTAAAKRGYVPGEIADYRFSAYQKIFADSDLAASIHFTGCALGGPPENPSETGGALFGLQFIRLRNGKPSAFGGARLPLERVPPVLLQEAWADYHALAATGTGPDPRWEAPAEW